MQLSTGLRAAMLLSTGLKGALDGGSILIYSGAAPATADAAVTGTLLVTITNGGGGIHMDTACPSPGVLDKLSSETWSGTIAATGVAGYFRQVASGDTGASSTTQARIQGSVGLAGADMNIGSTSLTSGGTQTIASYTVALPTL